MIRSAEFNDKKMLADLWQTCFGDDEKFINSFFDVFFEDADVTLMIKDEKVVCAAYCLNAVIESGGVTERAGYIYAVATLPEYRRHGYAEKVLEHLKEKALSSGRNLLFLTPSNEKNSDYYRSLGYEESFFCQKGTYKKTNSQNSAYRLEKFNGFDDTAFLENNNVKWSEKHIEFSLCVCNKNESSVLKKGEKTVGYAVVDNEKSFVSEIVCEEKLLNLFLDSICEKLGKDEITVMLPLENERLLCDSCKISRGMVYCFNTKSCKKLCNTVYLTDNLE